MDADWTAGTRTRGLHGERKFFFYQVSECGALSLFQRLHTLAVTAIQLVCNRDSIWPSQKATFARPWCQPPIRVNGEDSLGAIARITTSGY